MKEKDYSINLKFIRIEKRQNSFQKRKCLYSNLYNSPFTFSSTSPKPMSKTCKDDFQVLSAVSSPESSVPQATLDSERVMVSSSQSFTMPLNFFMIISGLECIKDIILIAQWKYLGKTNCRNLNFSLSTTKQPLKLKYLLIFILSQTKITNLKKTEGFLNSCSGNFQNFKGKL